jgi:hypothetical protein
MSKLVMSLCSVVFVVQTLGAQGRPYLSMLPDVDNIASTIPVNGDVNPYGVAIVPVTTGNLRADNILVSNFNNAGNLQGTGTTIVQVSPGGSVSLFAQLTTPLPGACPGGLGLTTALVALRSGFVIVGSLPTKDGMAATAQAGCLIVLNSSGTAIATLSGGGINGPWDMTALDSGSEATLFVANVLNGTVAANGAVVNQGTILRIVLSTPMGGTPGIKTVTTIASAFPERTDPNALVIGPTGLGLDAGGTLFVADTLDSRIAAIPNAAATTTDAGAGTTVAQNRALNMPLGLAIAPNGDILTVNGGDGRIVETTPDGKQAAVRFIDLSHSRNGAGTLFGLAVARNGSAVYFVDDGDNTLNVMER